jgi:hypothetical protein
VDARWTPDAPGADLPTWGQRTALRLLNLIGWNVRFKPLPGPHGIAVVYPHTSNWTSSSACWPSGRSACSSAGWPRIRCSAARWASSCATGAASRSTAARRRVRSAPGRGHAGLEMVLAGDHAGRHARLPPLLEERLLPHRAGGPGAAAAGRRSTTAARSSTSPHPDPDGRRSRRHGGDRRGLRRRAGEAPEGCGADPPGRAGFKTNQAASASRHRPAAPIAAPAMRRRRSPPSTTIPSPSQRRWPAGSRRRWPSPPVRVHAPGRAGSRTAPTSATASCGGMRSADAASTPSSSTVAAIESLQRRQHAVRQHPGAGSAQRHQHQEHRRQHHAVRCWRLHSPPPAAPAGGPSRQRVQQAGQPACFHAMSRMGRRRQRRIRPASPRPRIASSMFHTLPLVSMIEQALLADECDHLVHARRPCAGW